jgi:hypothetical protein
VEVVFEEPFATPSFVLVAMTNHTACYPVLKAQTESSAVIEIVRTKFTPEPSGVVNWIAMGTRA